jgi:DtxR family Mn-dependent transcriptional regulator
MSHLSITEENYLKSILKLSEHNHTKIGTNEIAYEINISAASVSDMLKKLADKKLIIYQKYYGVKLTKTGEHYAKNLVRKHRLWEVFLTQKLQFSWDEVHDLAEQLEHVKGDDMINRLEKFLGNPKFDPHGDPIPDNKGNIVVRKQQLLIELKKGEKAVIIGVKDTAATFLQFLDSIKISLGTKFTVIGVVIYDHSMQLKLQDGRELMLSQQVCSNIYVSS